MTSMLPPADEMAARVPEASYWAKFLGQRYVFKFGEYKVQAYFEITVGGYQGCIVELLMPVKRRSGGYAVSAERSKLGRSMKATFGRWQVAITELHSKADLIIQTRTVIKDHQGDLLHEQDQYSLVDCFWSDSVRPGAAPYKDIQSIPF